MIDFMSWAARGVVAILMPCAAGVMGFAALRDVRAPEAGVLAAAGVAVLVAALLMAVVIRILDLTAQANRQRQTLIDLQRSGPSNPRH